MRIERERMGEIKDKIDEGLGLEMIRMEEMRRRKVEKRKKGIEKNEEEEEGLRKIIERI